MADSPSSSRRWPVPMFVALIALSNLNPFASDSVLVALPQVSADLDADPTAVSLTFTAFLVGLAVGTLFLGTLSDALGRRLFLVGGPLVFALVSAACAMTYDLGALIALRVLQGAACAACAVAARAAVADWSGASRAARPFAIMAAGAYMAPLLAPIFGVVLLGAGSWHTIYWGMAVLGLVYAAGAAVLVPETLPSAERHGGGGLVMFSRMGAVVRKPGMALALASSAAAMAAHNAYVASAPFIVQVVLHAPPATYTGMIVVNTIVMILASSSLAFVAPRVPAIFVLRCAYTTGVASAAALVAVAALGVASLPIVWVLLMINAACMGFAVPASVALVQELGFPLQGTSAALQGFLNYLAAALASPVAVAAGAFVVPALGGLMGLLLGTAAMCAWRIARLSQ